MKPFSQQVILRLCVVTLVVLALFFGYTSDQLTIWKANHLKVLEKFQVQTTKQLLEQK